MDEWAKIAKSGSEARQKRRKKVMKNWQRFFSDNNQEELANHLASKGFSDEG